MATNSLRSALDDLASNFASAVLEAIRSASLEELVTGGTGWVPTERPALGRGPGRPRKTSTRSSPRTARQATSGPLETRQTKGGRLPRRSPEDIAKTLARIAALVKKSTGMRSEEIRKALDLDVREMPRVLKEGLAKKVLKSKGQKRATTYFVA